MRKGTMMMALVVLLVAIFATAAYAATIEGDSGNNELYETDGDDQMYGKRGVDDVWASMFWDIDDRDKLYGGRSSDYLEAWDGDGDDLVVGGRGKNDECVVDIGDEVRSCDGNVFREELPN